MIIVGIPFPSVNDTKVCAGAVAGGLVKFAGVLAASRSTLQSLESQQQMSHV